MAENKTQSDKKKTGLIWRVFRWIGLCLLVLLLIAAIFYQAYWKSITLLVFILAACTILPKPFRKWFWLTACAVVIALIVWVFLPEDNEGWRPYAFDKELAAFEAKYAIPDEENAALIYDELFETFDIDSNQPEFFVWSKPSSKDSSWLSKDHPETAEWLKGHQETIEKLMQAAKKNKCIFLPISADLMSDGEHIEHLPKVRQCACLLISSANNDVAEGRVDTALEKYLCVIRMANHMLQQPAMLYHIVGFGIESFALEQLNQFATESQASSEHLLLISNSIIGIENNWVTHWRKMLDFDKLFYKNSICGMCYEVNPKGKSRLTRDLAVRWRKQYPQDFPPLTYSQRKLHKAKTIPGWFVKPSTPQKAGEMIDAGYEKYYAMTEADFNWTTEPNQWDSILATFTASNLRRARFNFKNFIQSTTEMSKGSYHSMCKIYFKNLTLRRGSQLLIAIKKYHNEHGTWPDSLDEIKSLAPADTFIDPVTGEPLQYENHGERFSLFGETVNIWPK